MKLTSILVLAIATGTGLGQNPDVIQNTRDTMHALQQKKAMDTNTALAGSQGPAASPRPASGSAIQPAPAKPAPSAKPAPAAKPVAAKAPASPAPAKAAVQKTAPPPATAAKKDDSARVKAAPQVIAVPKAAGKPAPKAKPAAARKPAAAKQKVEVAAQASPDSKKAAPKPINLTGRRDPFVSPVVNRSMVGSGCSTGKKCLAIDQISLKGVVKAEAGMIAVVVNAMNKAYFLRENDPVFNGYVVKITGDSIVFKETLQDKLGKPFTREVTKRITTPAV